MSCAVLYSSTLPGLCISITCHTESSILSSSNPGRSLDFMQAGLRDYRTLRAISCSQSSLFALDVIAFSTRRDTEHGALLNVLRIVCQTSLLILLGGNVLGAPSSSSLNIAAGRNDGHLSGGTCWQVNQKQIPCGAHTFATVIVVRRTHALTDTPASIDRLISPRLLSFATRAISLLPASYRYVYYGDHRRLV